MPAIHALGRASARSTQLRDGHLDALSQLQIEKCKFMGMLKPQGQDSRASHANDMAARILHMEEKELEGSAVHSICSEMLDCGSPALPHRHAGLRKVTPLAN